MSSLPPNPSVLWLPQALNLRFFPFLILAAPLLLVPASSEGIPWETSCTWPPVPWVAQSFPAPQLETGDCQKYPLCCPAFLVPTPTCLPAATWPPASGLHLCIIPVPSLPLAWPRFRWPEFPATRCFLPAGTRPPGHGARGRFCPGSWCSHSPRAQALPLQTCRCQNLQIRSFFPDAG